MKGKQRKNKNDRCVTYLSNSKKKKKTRITYKWFYKSNKKNIIYDQYGIVLVIMDIWMNYGIK